VQRTGRDPRRFIHVVLIFASVWWFGWLVPGIRDNRSFPRILRWSAMPLKGEWNICEPVFSITFSILIVNIGV
jgi:hypothetical protein